MNEKNYSVDPNCVSRQLCVFGGLAGETVQSPRSGAVGADALVAGGQVGRHAEGNTDWKMVAEVLTYSRTRGVFAGVSLNGAVLKQDKASTGEFYGHMMTFKAGLTGEVAPPAGANA